MLATEQKSGLLNPAGLLGKQFLKLIKIFKLWVLRDPKAIAIQRWRKHYRHTNIFYDFLLGEIAWYLMLVVITGNTRKQSSLAMVVRSTCSSRQSSSMIIARGVFLLTQESPVSTTVCLTGMCRRG